MNSALSILRSLAEGYGDEPVDEISEAEGVIENRRIYRHEEYFAYCRAIGRDSREPDLRTMPYEEFLKTPYWQDFRERLKKARQGVCERCCNGRRLDVHHKHYNHRGLEYWYPDDLMVLCRRCHASEHDTKAIIREATTLGDGKDVLMRKAAAFDRIEAENKRLHDKIATLEAELARKAITQSDFESLGVPMRRNGK